MDSNLLTRDQATRETYSTDASLFKVEPEAVAFPKDAEELKQLVAYAKKHQTSLTMRAAGTDMSGGPLNTGIIADTTRFMNRIGEITPVDKGLSSVTVEPGVFYRDLEKKTRAHGLLLPCYPASKDLAALGGMVGNNCGGELSLRYGKMENFVIESKYIFSDGNEYVVKPLTGSELDAKMAENTFEGRLYASLVSLIWHHKDIIKAAKPKVAKNSAGYFLWNAWDGRTFDLNKILTGAQGTLGLMTEATLRLVPEKTHHDLIAVFLSSWDELPKVVNAILPHEPESLETFDKETIKLGLRFFPEIARKAHTNIFSFLFKFLPEALVGLRMGGLPEIIILIEIAETTPQEVDSKREALLKTLKELDVLHRAITKDSEEEKFWIVRRESFNLLRHHASGKRTVPLIDDFCIPPERVPEALPEMKALLEKFDIPVNIAGHAGEGNFHIIPLMDLTLASEREKLLPVAHAFYDLVAKYKGTTTGEHNDGIVRTPFLSKIYSPEVLDLFTQVKNICDPENIFNPGKKIGGSFADFERYLTNR